MRYNLEYFSGKNWSFVLIKKDRIIFKSKLQGLKPLISCIKRREKEIRGAIVFDKMVGRAAAILLAHAKVKEIWTPVVSREAKRILAKNEIKLVFLKEVKNIMNRRGNDTCPMEKMSRKMPEKEFITRMLKH